jgi:primosomal protein N' (replication factor Y)
VAPTGDDPQLARDPGAATARLPSLAWETARKALQAGAPVLVQVPRRGYALSLVCADCRARVTCPHCGGPLAQPAAGRSLGCRWCGRVTVHWQCAECGGERLSAPVVGSHRTAEELGRALPGVPVRTSAGDSVIARVPARPALVIATPGAEPVADGGYGAAVLLDGWALLSRADMRADEEALRRWMNAAALVRPAPAGGSVLLVADPAARPVQALVAWSPDRFAEREYAERLEARLPPGARLASLEGPAGAVADLLAHARLPQPVEVLGPVPIEEPGQSPIDAGDAAEEPRVRTIVRTPLAAGAALATALRAAAATRSAAKAPGSVRIRLDPVPML